MPKKHQPKSQKTNRSTRMRRAAEKLAQEAEAALKALINRPGTKRNPSKQGEPPKRRTGGYQGSIASAVSLRGSQLKITIYSKHPKKIGPILEHKLNRPHFATIAKKYKRQFVSLMAKAAAGE